MPNQNPPDIPEQEQQGPHFGKYGFEPLKVFFPGETPMGTILSEQVEVGIPPMGHLQRRHVDVMTTDAHMLMRAKRKPTDWRALTWTFDGFRPAMILGIRVGRESVLFFNGSGQVLFARKERDCSANSNENFVLNINNTLALETEGEFWATADAGTTLNVVETWYDLPSIELAAKKIKHEKLNFERFGNLQESTQERKLG